MKHLKTNLPLRNKSVTALFMNYFMVIDMVIPDYILHSIFNPINNYILTQVITHIYTCFHPILNPNDFKIDFLIKYTSHRTISKYTQNASKIIEFYTLIDRYHLAIDSSMHPDKFLLIGVWMEQIIF